MINAGNGNACTKVVEGHSVGCANILCTTLKVNESHGEMRDARFEQLPSGMIRHYP